MEIAANPALLGVLASVLMLGAWALGRWQARFALSPNGPAALPLPRDAEISRSIPQTQMPGSAAKQGRPRAESEGAGEVLDTGACDHAMSLCDLHAEVSAFRRREQVLASLETDALLLDRLLRTSARACAADVTPATSMVSASTSRPMPNRTAETGGHT